MRVTHKPAYLTYLHFLASTNVYDLFHTKGSFGKVTYYITDHDRRAMPGLEEGMEVVELFYRKEHV